MVMYRCDAGSFDVGSRFEHSRMIVGSPRAGTARPDVCTITRIARGTVYYRNESKMLLSTPLADFGNSVKRFIREGERDGVPS